MGQWAIHPPCKAASVIWCRVILNLNDLGNALYGVISKQAISQPGSVGYQQAQAEYQRTHNAQNQYEQYLSKQALWPKVSRLASFHAELL